MYEHILGTRRSITKKIGFDTTAAVPTYGSQ